MDYKLIRSKRKTISIQMTEGGLVVRAPFSASGRSIDSFVKKHKLWIEKRAAEIERRRAEADKYPPLTDDDIRDLAKRALSYIPKRAEHYAGMAGVKYGRITIRNQRTRWGSCSSKGNLNFNCLLMLTPPEVIDSVVVHELCHLKHLDHSKAFYAEVRSIFPEYDKWSAWLKENGKVILLRAERGET